MGDDLKWHSWQHVLEAEDRPTCAADTRWARTVTSATAAAATVAVVLYVVCPPFVARRRVSKFEAAEPSYGRVLVWAVLAAAATALLPRLLRPSAAPAPQISVAPL